MTKEQFKEYVEQVMMDQNRDWKMSPHIDKIVAQWESDVNDARIAGQNAYDPEFADRLENR